jgi:GDPmannose 4,6-dehydratase
VTTAVILGSNGQDGSYLANILLERGFDVVGAARQAQSRWISHPRFRHVELDVAEAAELSGLLNEVRPTRIYALAAIHGPAGYAYEANWRKALDVNVGSVHTCLEYLRRSPSARLFLASSLKAFGQSPPKVIDEATPRVSSCLYSITKNTAADLVAYYRAVHGVWAVVGYLFNHDSPRRPADYFLPRLVDQLATRLRGESRAEPLATFDFWCDWGSSLEYMDAATKLLELDEPRDVVVASGVPIYAAELVTALSMAADMPQGAWATASAMTAESSSLGPPYRARIDALRRYVGSPRSDGLDVALWILRERHGVNLDRPVDHRWSRAN